MQPGNLQPVVRFTEHTAAVKAIAWSPHQHGLLASGGGTADRCIRFWNTSTNTMLNCIDTGSQVSVMRVAWPVSCLPVDDIAPLCTERLCARTIAGC